MARDQAAGGEAEAARAWSIWEGSTSRLLFDYKSIEKFADPEFALAFARIECHYFMHNCFFASENYLVENVGKIRHIPGVIVQGRYDIVCPMTSAWDLHRVIIEVVVDNGRSRAIPKRLGFREEALLREAKLIRGRYEDAVLYAMLASEWPAAPLEATGNA